MKNIILLGIFIISSITLVACSSPQDQFKYVAPPPTQGNLKSNDLDLKQPTKTIHIENSEQ